MGNNNLVIRTDATSQVGAGHLMRCLALAQAWQDRGGKATFITYCDSAILKERLLEEGFNFIALKKPYPHPEDLECTFRVLHETNGRKFSRDNWVVVDGYHFDAQYQRQIKDAGFSILWIDDNGHAERYYADLVLNQNISADSSWYINCDPDTRLLLGPRYSLLRREFIEQGQHQKKIFATAHKVLVTLGGADPDGFTLQVIQALKLSNDPEMEVAIVVGPANRHFKEIESHLQQSSFAFRLLPAVKNMAELMAWADIAISAGGSTCWELAFMGLPTIVIILADNQQPVAEKLGLLGVVLNLGWHTTLIPEQISQLISKLLSSPDTRRQMAQRGQVMVDGQGANRVVNLLVDWFE